MLFIQDPYNSSRATKDTGYREEEDLVALFERDIERERGREMAGLVAVDEVEMKEEEGVGGGSPGKLAEGERREGTAGQRRHRHGSPGGNGLQTVQRDLKV